MSAPMVEAYIDGHWIAVGEGPYERVMVGWCEVFHPQLGVVAVLPRNYPLRYQPDA